MGTPGPIHNKERAGLGRSICNSAVLRTPDIDVRMSEETPPPDTCLRRARHQNRSEPHADKMLPETENCQQTWGWGRAGGGRHRHDCRRRLAGVGTLFLVPVLGRLACGPIAALPPSGAFRPCGAFDRVPLYENGPSPERRIEERNRAFARAAFCWELKAAAHRMRSNFGAGVASEWREEFRAFISKDSTSARSTGPALARPNVQWPWSLWSYRCRDGTQPKSPPMSLDHPKLIFLFMRVQERRRYTGPRSDPSELLGRWPPPRRRSPSN